MFYVVCLLTPLYRRFRRSRVSHVQGLDRIYRLVSKILDFMACGSVLGDFCVSCKNFVGSASIINRNSIEILSKFYRNSIEKWKMMPKELRWQEWWVYEGAWWGLKSKMMVLLLLFEGSTAAWGRQPQEAERAEAVGGRVNPPPCGLVWGFGGFVTVGASTRLEAEPRRI